LTLEPCIAGGLSGVSLPDEFCYVVIETHDLGLQPYDLVGRLGAQDAIPEVASSFPQSGY